MNQIGETPTNIIHRLGVRGIVVTQALRAEKKSKPPLLKMHPPVRKIIRIQ